MQSFGMAFKTHAYPWSLFASGRASSLSTGQLLIWPPGGNLPWFHELDSDWPTKYTALQVSFDGNLFGKPMVNAV